MTCIEDPKLQNRCSVHAAVSLSDILDELANAVDPIDPEKMIALSKRKFEVGDRVEIMENGTAWRLRRVGERFESFEAFPTDLAGAAAARKALEWILRRVIGTALKSQRSLGRAVLGTVAQRIFPPN